MKAAASPVRFIDLFAGPGGLGEGFASLARTGMAPRGSAFESALSIEKDPLAHRTLELRAFFRHFPPGKAPEDYYDYLRGDVTRGELFARHPKAADAARREAWCAELGNPDPGRAAVHDRIRTALGKTENWVLLGGPPCQAYSLVGRSRNKGNSRYVPEKDKRQTLYIEYLQVIADHWPAVFVMENVKGMLSASLNDRKIFQRIQEDLSDPATALSSTFAVFDGGFHERGLTKNRTPPYIR